MPVEILRLSLLEFCEAMGLDHRRFNNVKMVWEPVSGDKDIGTWRRDILIYQEPKDADARQHTGPLPGR